MTPQPVVCPWRVRLAKRGRWALLGVASLAMLLTALGISGDPAEAQTSVSPVLSCSGSMVLDSGSGQCRTPRTETALRPSSCSAGSTRVAGEYGGHVCQRRVVRTVDTGRTRRVYSHTTYSEVWITTGTQQVQTGVNRTWVPARTHVEPLVPPVRVRVGSRRRCDFDPISGLQYNCRNVPVYRYQTTHTVTIPGYWREVPVYSEVETGYWDRVPTIHYTTEPIYQTVTQWITAPATLGPCAPGWRAAGSQCARTVLGEPSSAPHQSCPSGSVPRYADPLGGFGSGVVSCQASGPESGVDTGTEQDSGGGPEHSLDGTARPLHHLAGESDERLAELGIHRCSDGLLSYVPCAELPGRTWDSEPDVCDDIEGTVYRPDHGGSCVTASDLLSKCIAPGDCEETTIRTYCPAIGELSNTQIQEHADPVRGSETYRVCVFDCADFAALPPYVQSRINGSYDYACLPVPEPESTTEATTSTTTTTTTTSEVQREDADVGVHDPDDSGGPGDGGTGGRPVDSSEPDDDDPVDDDPLEPEEDPCASAPPEAAMHDVADRLTWHSHVPAASSGSGPQWRMPGGGKYLQVAPGRGWMHLVDPLEVDDGTCIWIATSVRTSWSELRPWVPAERALMEANSDTRHLVDRWEALSLAQQSLLVQWHRPGAVPAKVSCTVDEAAGSAASSACSWLIRFPAAYSWRAEACFEASPENGTADESAEPLLADGECWVVLAAGTGWIRSLSDYADGRVTLTPDGTQP